jgi:hypothetical protein
MKTTTLVTVALVAAALGCTSCGGKNQGSNQTCSGFAIDVEEVWSASIKAEIQGYGGGLSAEQVQKVSTRMDTIALDWVMLREAACLDHKNGFINAEQYAQKVQCFDAFLQRQRTLLGALKDGDASTIDALGLGETGQEVGTCR